MQVKYIATLADEVMFVRVENKGDKIAPCAAAHVAREMMSVVVRSGGPQQFKVPASEKSRMAIIRLDCQDNEKLFSPKTRAVSD
jgi:hypothetical protein